MPRLRITWTKGIGFVCLLISLAVFGVCNIVDYYSLVTYIVLLLLLTMSLLLINEMDYISPNILFLVYFLYTVAIGPIVLLYRGTEYNYNFQNVILGGLLCFTCGNLIGNIGKKKSVISKNESSRIKLKFGVITRKDILFFLYAVSVLASIYYILINGAILSENVDSNRVEAMSGNGLLVYSMRLPIVIIPMLYDIYFETKKKGNPALSLAALVAMICVSTVAMLVIGYRNPVMTMYVCLICIYAKRNQMKITKLIRLAVILILAVTLLGVGRHFLSDQSVSIAAYFTSSLYVNASNLNYVFRNFPTRVPYQYGYTYLVNLIMMLPGPGQDFTLWLKEQLGMSFAGGGVTPTIMGEFYMNFGYASIFIGMFCLGMFGVALNRYAHKRKFGFLAVYYVWEFAHCASGGIANVMVTVILFTMVNNIVLMLPQQNYDRKKMVKI